MAKKAKAMDPAVSAHVAIVESETADFEAIDLLVSEAFHAALARAQAAWIANGGCPNCHGAGGHSHWDDYFPCTGPNQTGCLGYGGNVAPDHTGSYDRSIPYPTAARWRPTDELGEWVAARDEHKRARIEQRQIDRGRIAIVIKGRKVPPGLIAPVVAVVDGTWGARAGLLVGRHVEGARDGILWVAVENLEVAEGLPAEVKADLMVAYESNRAAYARAKGREPRPFYSPEAWAAVGVK